MDALEIKSQAALDHEAVDARPGRSEPNNLRDQVAVREGVRLWKTPCATDGEGGVMEMRPGAAGHFKLRDQVLPMNVHAQPIMYPTPTAQDAKNTGGPSQSGRHTIPLNTLVTLLPTPNACQAHNNGRLDEWGGSGNPFRGTPEGKACLNPEWVELLMGLPLGWTALSAGAKVGKTVYPGPVPLTKGGLKD
jgi:hypothetical protein